MSSLPDTVCVYMYCNCVCVCLCFSMYLHFDDALLFLALHFDVFCLSPLPPLSLSLLRIESYR